MRVVVAHGIPRVGPVQTHGSNLVGDLPGSRPGETPAGIKAARRRLLPAPASPDRSGALGRGPVRARRRPGPDRCDPSDGTYAARTTAALKKRVGPTTSDASTGTYAKGARFRVQCYTDSGQKWYLTDGSRWVRASYVKTSSKVRYCSNL